MHYTRRLLLAVLVPGLVLGRNLSGNEKADLMCFVAGECIGTIIVYDKVFHFLNLIAIIPVKYSGK
jgi:hypothetical protein